MEILTVKNNKMDYSTFKKIIILFFPTKSKILFVAASSFDLIFLLIGLFMRDFSFCITLAIILLFLVIFHLALSRTVLKQLMKQQIERFNKDVIYFDLVFEEDELYSKVDSSTNKAPIKYKDLKKINETNDIVFFTSNAGFKIYFEKKMPAVKTLRDYMHFLISRTSFGENQFYSKENLFDSHIKEVF